jgi:hypothetical protein
MQIEDHKDDLIGIIAMKSELNLLRIQFPIAPFPSLNFPSTSGAAKLTSPRSTVHA